MMFLKLSPGWAHSRLIIQQLLALPLARPSIFEHAPPSGLMLHSTYLAFAASALTETLEVRISTSGVGLQLTCSIWAAST